ncbi:MAG: hypothetical protein P8184_18680, partial [Calditrichia bacterium]
IPIIIIIPLIVFINCNTEDGPDFGPYYQKSYVDSVFAVIPTDTVHIIIEEFDLGPPQRQDIFYKTVNKQSLNDTIKITLKVNFGSYSPNPDPVKDLQILNDTLYIWYAARERPESLNLNKRHSISTITNVETNPKLDYYSIEEAIIHKSPNKIISFETKFYN